MFKYKSYLLILVLLLCGCASVPQEPDEEPISIKLKGTSVEVQTFIEEFVYRGNPKATVLNADNRSITFQTYCMDIEGYGGMSCALIMMTVGNSGWDGPYLNFTYRTSEIRGEVRVTLSSSWCATNAFGKTNCGSASSNKERNEALRNLKMRYESQ